MAEKDQASSPVAEMVTDEKMEDDIEKVKDVLTDTVTDTATDGDTEQVTETGDSTTQEATETTDKLPDVTDQEPPPVELLTAEESVQIFAAILLEQLSMLVTAHIVSETPPVKVVHSVHCAPCWLVCLNLCGKIL